MLVQTRVAMSGSNSCLAERFILMEVAVFMSHHFVFDPVNTTEVDTGASLMTALCHMAPTWHTVLQLAGTATTITCAIHLPTTPSTACVDKRACTLQGWSPHSASCLLSAPEH
jgi:hypothetical protein